MPLGDQAILEIVIRQLARQGFTHITLSVGHLAHLIEAVFGDGSDHGVEITYVFEDMPLGTARPSRARRAASVSPAARARKMACPVTPMMSLTAVANFTLTVSSNL